MHALLTALHWLAGIAGASFWLLGMHYWGRLYYAEQPSRAERRWRMVRAFLLMGIFGLIAFGLRAAKDAIAVD